jgi:succinate dehydrogenase flavin-adding protein (antitoxin of CptAB toxin-antitoxin module)
MATMKENNEKIVEIMKQWQHIEDESIKTMNVILKKTDNPLISLVMDIIKHDSGFHRRTQQAIIDHFEKQPFTMTPDELVDFWDMIEEHDKVEKKTIELAKEAKKYTNYPLVQYLINYLLEDEQKHDNLLEEMEKIKGGMYPYNG